MNLISPDRIGGSGNLALPGTDNTAASQTRTGGSSVMTSSLTDSRVMDVIEANTLLWNNNPQWRSAPTGTSVGGIEGSLYRIQNSSATAGTPYFSPFVGITAASSVDFSKQFRLMIVFSANRLNSLSNWIFEFGQNAQTGAPTISPAPAVLSEGWYFTNGVWTPFASNGTTLTTGANVTDTTMIVNVYNIMKLEHIPGTGLKLSLMLWGGTGWTTVGTTSSPGTGIPTGYGTFSIGLVINGVSDGMILDFYKIALTNTDGF